MITHEQAKIRAKKISKDLMNLANNCGSANSEIFDAAIKADIALRDVLKDTT